MSSVRKRGTTRASQLQFWKPEARKHRFWGERYATCRSTLLGRAQTPRSIVCRTTRAWPGPAFLDSRGAGQYHPLAHPDGMFLMNRSFLTGALGALLVVLAAGAGYLV